MEQKTMRKCRKMGYLFAFFFGLFVFIGCSGEKTLKLFSGNPTPTEFLTRDAACYEEIKNLKENDIIKLFRTENAFFTEPLENGSKTLGTFKDLPWGRAVTEFIIRGRSVVGMTYYANIQDIRVGKYKTVQETKEKLENATGKTLEPVRGLPGNYWSMPDKSDNAFFRILYDDVWSDEQNFMISVTLSFGEEK